MSTFGDKIRRQRELRGISLEAISATTKISARMLRAIEDESFDQLPGGVFNKGFVRAYARQIGLDEDEAIADYLVALSESQARAQAILPNFRQGSGTAQAYTPPSFDRSETTLEAVDETSLASGHSHDSQIPEESSLKTHEVHAQPLQNRRSGDRRRKDRRSGNEASGFQTTPNSTPIVQTFTLEQAPPQHIAWKKVAAGLLLLILVAGFWNYRRGNHQRPAVQAVNSSPARSVQASTPNLVPSAITTIHHSEIVNHPRAKTVSAVLPRSPQEPFSPAAPAKFTLLIRAAQNSWISIAADGQTVATESLIAPAQTSVRATKEIVIRAGNSAGISFLLNGKNIPAPGKPGEVRTYIFGPHGIRESTALPSPSSASTTN